MKPLDMMHLCPKCLTSFQLLETSDKPKKRDILQNNQSILFKFQGHERQGKKLLQTGGDKGEIITTYKGQSWIRSCNRKGTLGD